jgi:hypothetical protein
MRKLVIGMLAVLLGGGVAVPTAAAEPSTDAGTLALVSIPARRVPVDGFFIPPKVGSADAEFEGHGPDITASATLLVGSRQLRVQIFMDAIETVSDFTHAQGTSTPYLLYTAPAGQCIVSVSRGEFDEIEYIDSDHDNDIFPGQVTGSFVRTWTFVGDTAGSEAGTRTGAAVTTFAFTADVQRC